MPIGFACALPGTAVDDDELVDVLVDDVGILGAVGLDGRLGARELPALPEDVAVPAALDLLPVRAVAVHRNVLPAAARGDAVIEALRVIRRQEGLEGLDVFERALLAHVAAVEEDMDANLLDALDRAARDHRFEVVDVRMHVAVGEEADEMDGPAGRALLDVADELLPGGALEHRSRRDGVGDELGALRVDAAAADGVMADLGVAHVLVGGQADGQAVGLEPRVGRRGLHGPEGPHLGIGDRVALRILAVAHAVHYHEHEGAAPAFPGGILREGFYHVVLLAGRRDRVTRRNTR